MTDKKHLAVEIARDKTDVIITISNPDVYSAIMLYDQIHKEAEEGSICITMHVGRKMA
jgi:hypothetical protein